MSASMSEGAPTPEASILAAYRAQNRAMVDADLDALDAILAPEYTAVHVSGYAQPKAEWLEQIGARRMTYHRIEERSSVVRVAGSTAVLDARAIVHATIYGSRAAWPLHSVTSYRRIDGRWHAVHSRAETY